MTGKIIGRFTSGTGWSEVVAARLADLAAGAGTATVTRAEEAPGGVYSSSKSVVGTPECATPDGSMRRGSVVAAATGVAISIELGGCVFRRAYLASAATFYFLARSAFEVAASAA